MKSNILILLFITTMFQPVLSQEINKKYFDKRVGSEVLIDLCDRSGLEEGIFGEIYAAKYEGYRPNETIINDFKNKIDGISITLVFGSWCHDSKVQVPPFMKILEQISFDEEYLSIVGVDRMKKAHNYNINDLKVQYVPTFIIYRDEVEIGRIVERPKKSLEKDLLEILK